YWQVPAYMLLLAGLVRFFHFAPFEEALLSARNYLFYFSFFLLFSSLGYPLVRAPPMSTQYGLPVPPPSPLGLRPPPPLPQVGASPGARAPAWPWVGVHRPRSPSACAAASCPGLPPHPAFGRGF